MHNVWSRVKLMSVTFLRFVLVISFSFSCYAGHYKYHPEEYRTAVTELLMKASSLYASRRQLNGYEVGTSEHSDMPPSVSDHHRTAASSNNRLRRAPIDATDQFFLPGSMEYHESSDGPKPELFNMPSVESLSLHGVLGQVLHDECVPKNVEGWELKPSASSHVHTVAGRHGSFNPMKCVRRSRLWKFWLGEHLDVHTGECVYTVRESGWWMLVNLKIAIIHGMKCEIQFCKSGGVHVYIHG